MKLLKLTKKEKICLDKKRDSLKDAIESGDNSEIHKANRSLQSFIAYLSRNRLK